MQGPQVKRAYQVVPPPLTETKMPAKLKRHGTLYSSWLCAMNGVTTIDESEFQTEHVILGYHLGGTPGSLRCVTKVVAAIALHQDTVAL